MLVDTGAQISLINKQILQKKADINTNNGITISSIHGSEKTLGNIKANITKNNVQLPIQLQVTKNNALKEDGILGYDILGKSAIINGPKKILSMKAGSSFLKFPLKSETESSKPEDYMASLRNIEYLNHNEINPHYQVNLQRVQSITHEINENKIQIKPLNIG